MKIETERLIMRPYKLKDVNDIVVGLNDFDTAKNLTVPFPYTKENAKEFLNFVKQNKNDYYLAIVLKDSDKLIGGTSIEFKDNKVKGGIWISKKYQHLGYDTEVMKERAKYIFENLKFDKIENGYFDFNDNSWKMQQKIGYEIVGEKTNYCPALKKEVKEIVTELTKERFRNPKELYMKICLVQCQSKHDIKSNLTFAKNTIEKVTKKGCDLIIFPEMFLTGYVATEKTKTIGITKTDSLVKELQSVCKRNNIACVFGFPRKEKSKIFNSACFIDKNGEMVGLYDKTHLFGDEKIYFSAGNELKVFDTSFGKIGMLICYDIEFPETARVLALNGAEMIVCISANMKPYDNLHKMCIISRAIENSIPIVYCNYVGKDSQFTFVGQSNIINSNGKNECKFSNHDALLYGTLNLSKNCDDYNMNYLKNLRKDLYKY